MIFELEEQQVIQNMIPRLGYDGFGELVYYRTFSRLKKDGSQESWADTVIRVINGVMSIRKTHMLHQKLPWCEDKMQFLALKMAVSLFRLEWSPPGRGLWSMGTPLIQQRGAMALYNCAYTDIGEDWIDDLAWLMDALMFGVGVGFNAGPEPCVLQNISQSDTSYIVDDSREGWVASVKYLLECYRDGVGYPKFDYTYIRKIGEPLVTFGGTASGPGPLTKLHERIHVLCRMFINNKIGTTQLKTDLANIIGCCVVAGNIRRSAQIALGNPTDPVFMDLKNYTKHPERKDYGWMSNNSNVFKEHTDYSELANVAYRIMHDEDLGVFNHKNVKYARFGDTSYGVDVGVGLNPCGEIILENKELCNLAITCPTRCADTETWLRACEYATFYASTVTLLPTHQNETNAVVARNRRIGIDILDFAGWKDQISTHEVIKYLRQGYNIVRKVNKELAIEAGIPISIRVTTIKPNGTVSKLVGRAPTYTNATYMLRRIRIQKGTLIDELMQDANIPFEPCVNEPDYTNVFEYPIYNGYVREIKDVSLWEQAANVVLLQREWADNAVSNTLYFNPDESNDVEHVLSSIVPVTKSISMAPMDVSKVYAQAPEERISIEEYTKRKLEIQTIDWSKFRGDGQDEKYCTAESCI